MLKSGDTIGSRISQILDELNLKPFSFAEKLRAKIPGYKMSHTSIGRFIRNEFEPKNNFFDAVEEAFGYSGEWLRTGEGEMKKSDRVSDQSTAYNTYREASIYGEVLCGAPASQWQQDNVVKMIPTDVRDKSAFGVIAKGSSMEPYINDKDILICVDNPHLIKDKSAVVTVFKSEPGTTNTNAKLIIKKEKTKEIILYSINTKTPPEIYKESEILKIYKVVRIIREVK